ncbi:GABRR [Lepeophtheirus salmonis]|uniref:GABRR n=1 Tax=Lepeophtheirus salmonis TaxID=72036 RepID=A0A7R8H3K9_LEPSM|nr:GABRR [Lepeophtheirus salmonis]CAF2831733.1 GABRR [Lepeophtheirus salmonis]
MPKKIHSCKKHCQEFSFRKSVHLSPNQLVRSHLKVIWNGEICLSVNDISQNFAIPRNFIKDLTLGGRAPNLVHENEVYMFRGMITLGFCSSKLLGKGYLNEVLLWNKVPRGSDIYQWGSSISEFKIGKYGKFTKGKRIRRMLCEKVRTPTLHGKGNRKISKHGYGYVLINNEPEDTKCLLKLKPSCSFTSRKFYLRGLSPDIQSKVDYKYISTIQGSHLKFKGFTKSIITNINNSNGTNLWVIMDTFDYLKIFAFYNGSKLIPWGINIWFFKGNNNEVIQERLLKLTKCTASEFSCDDSNCIPRSSVCNDVADCFSGEDEINCGSIGLNAYQKEFPPSSNENGQKKIPLQIQFHLKSINFIDEMGELLEVRYQLKLKWRDSRIIFYNLINDKRHILTDNEINRIWSPLLMFEKSVEEDKILLDKKGIQITVLKDPNATGYPNSIEDLYEKTYYKGSDVQLIATIENNLKIYCNFNFRNYPFDTQNCSIEIRLPFDLKNKIALIMNETLTWDPIQLLKFEISGLGFISCHGSDAHSNSYHIKENVYQFTLDDISPNILPTSCCHVDALLPSGKI